MNAENRPTGYDAVEGRYDGGEYHVELSELPRSRAPSYVSSKSFWDGRDDDQESLIAHNRISSGFDQYKDLETTGRRDTNLSTTSTNREKRKHWLTGQRYGWHFGVSCAAGTAAFVLWLNVILTIFAAAKFGTAGGIGTAYEGSCDVVNRWTTWLHILINGLSSLLLSASNYTMQALSAPTRSEVDKAHAKGDWVDIGVASVRNLFRIKRHRVVLWVILAISSIPIHLLYNSAIFKTIDSNQYIAVVANRQWFDNGNFSVVIPWDGAPANISPYNYSTSTNDDYYYITWSWALDELTAVQDLFARDRDNTSNFRNLSNTECINAYSASFVSGYNHVVLVTNDTGTLVNESMFYATKATGQGSLYSDGNWLCYSDYNATDKTTCDSGSLKKNVENWKINGRTIDHCVAQVQPEHCTLQFSIQILVAVIICNAMKAGSMLITLYKQKDVTLVTIGDAIASFLEHPNEKTKGRCLMSRADIDTWRLQGTDNMPNTNPLPKTYFAKSSRWFAAASRGRWTTTFILIILSLITSIILLDMGYSNLSGSGISPFALGFGAINSNAVISIYLPTGGASGLVSAVLLANLPQAIVSFLYLLYNSLMTSLILAREWATYSSRRKPLRVTTPYGAQRSTYYLQLPFRYSGPLLAISATLHWVISQSIFMVRINVYDNGAPVLDSDISQVGYSCPPILTAILIGTVLLCTALGMGFQKFRGQMPVASSCSVAIAAACHPPKDDFDAAYVPVQWGEVRGMRSDETGHCCFTSAAVDELTPGRMYAGGSRSTARSHVYSSNQSLSHRTASMVR